MLFGCGPNSHLLAVATKTKLSVLNLLTCSVSWSRPLAVTVLCNHAPTGHMAAFTTCHKCKYYGDERKEPLLASGVINCLVSPSWFEFVWDHKIVYSCKYMHNEQAILSLLKLTGDKNKILVFYYTKVRGRIVI